uniref:Uncharacterized protein n=1 Tax=Anguilla anguilla TaxID=7936 RepID=A0A0E9UUQ2_ANGAN
MTSNSQASSDEELIILPITHEGYVLYK